MAFHVGQKVVCIDASVGNKGWHAQNNIPFGIIEGQVYTICRIYEGRGWYKNILEKDISLELVEVKKTPAPNTPDQNGYRSDRFRPLVENKTDISTFTRLLNFPQVKIEKDQFDLVEM